ERRQQQQQQNNNGNSSSSNANGNTSNSGQSSTNNGDYNYTDKSQFTWPVPGYYHISYGVGWRWGAYHKGIDIWSPGIRGAKICAAAEGTVILVSNTCTHDYGKNGSCGCGGGYGNYCIIDHGNGYWTLYGHSQYMSVTQGQHVNKGDVLGIVGSTGYSTGDHLHFEVRLNGVAQNPSNYV
ncbi:M23 family metallopeptidase, partial [Ruminococcus sp.]